MRIITSFIAKGLFRQSTKRYSVPLFLQFLLFIILGQVSGETKPPAKRADFAGFDKQARAGERLSVVFFGASLTWGANASDPMKSSYRAIVANKLEEKYPMARFKFHDAAIGGTGSQLGVFRLERDVLKYQPDLVFLDFSANDGITTSDSETLSSYEAIVRQLVKYNRVPVVQVAFPFLWNVKYGSPESLKRLIAHKRISKAYQTAFGDAVRHCREKISSGEASFESVWPFDGVHPGDEGYKLFANAAWQAFEQAVKEKRVCRVPDEMLHEKTYTKSNRFRISALKTLPRGWKISVPNPVAAHHDMLMSRWLDDEVVASCSKGKAPQVDPIKIQFRGRMVMLFGESTEKSAKYKILLNGKEVEHEVQVGKKKVSSIEFNAAELAERVKGNCQLVQLVATNLDENKKHVLEIIPLFTGKSDQEIRLESLCVAGEKAFVFSD